MEFSEVEFLAEETNVTVVPNFNLECINLFCGSIGPFTAGVPVDVPLWVAISLKRKQKCRVQAPTWMDIERLTEIKRAEVESSYFTEMPSPCYMEIAQLLFVNAVDDVSATPEMRMLIKDIWDIRISKLQKSIKEFLTSDYDHAKVTHLTLMEINHVRQMLGLSLSHMHAIRYSSALSGSDVQDLGTSESEASELAGTGSERASFWPEPIGEASAGGSASVRL